MLLIITYGIVLLILTIYSYALIDPNLTLVNHPLWLFFRDPLVQFGYHQRWYSWYIYLILIALLFIFHIVFLKRKYESAFKLACIIGLILLMSYPMLSHDFFNYIFDAKIFTYYGLNPYTHKALDFPQDQWVRFMHWTHRSYPYGPVFLLISFIPSYLGMGIFLFHFFFFKLMFVLFYLLGVYMLAKRDKRHALQFATHPFVLIEGLVSSHNDLIGVVLGIIGIYFIFKKNQVLSFLFTALSIGIKYLTFPLLFVNIPHKRSIQFAFFATVGSILYVSFTRDIQQWYFLTLIMFIPFYSGLIEKLSIFFFGLLLSYYPYIMLGGWDTDEKVWLKKVIILTAMAINLIYLALINNKINITSGMLKNYVRKK